MEIVHSPPANDDWVLPLSRLPTGLFWKAAADTDEIPLCPGVNELSCFSKTGALTKFLPVEKKMTDSLWTAWRNGCPSSLLRSCSSSGFDSTLASVVWFYRTGGSEKTTQSANSCKMNLWKVVNSTGSLLTVEPCACGFGSVSDTWVPCSSSWSWNNLWTTSCWQTTKSRW